MESVFSFIMKHSVTYILRLWWHVLLHPFRHVHEDVSVDHPVYSTATTGMATDDEICAIGLVPKTVIVGILVSGDILRTKWTHRPPNMS